jgi:hypothetical protein
MASIKKQREAALAAGAGDSNTLLGASTTGRSARWIVITDVPMALDAISLCELITNEVMKVHREAIADGVKADGSGPQPPLDPKGTSGRAAAKGLRPNLRGVTAKGSFPASLTRSQVKVTGTKMMSGRQGTKARATITAAPRLRGWLGREAARGVGYFTAHGAVIERVQRVLLEWTQAAIRPVPAKR